MNSPLARVNLLKFIPHFHVGGTERQFVYLANGIDRSRFDVRVACLARTGPLLSDLEAGGAPIIEYRTNSLASYQTLRSQLRLARKIRRERIHIVHAYGFYSNVFAIPAARVARNCVAIASVRDTGVFPDREEMRRRALVTVCRWSDCVLTNSHAAREWLIRHGLNHEIRVIPNGIVIPAPRRPAADFPIRTELNIKPDVPVVALIGRLTRTKGIEYFLDAAVDVRTRFPDVRFLVVGEANIDPPYRFQLENRAAALGLGKDIIFTGQRSDIPKLLEEITISVLPSLSESFSNSVLESMAAGVPVVTTSVGGNPELIVDGKDGMLVPPRDTEALARSICRLLESPELRHRFAQAARQKVIEKYSLQCVLRQTEQLYLTLLDRRGLRP